MVWEAQNDQTSTPNGHKMTSRIIKESKSQPVRSTIAKSDLKKARVRRTQTSNKSPTIPEWPPGRGRGGVRSIFIYDQETVIPDLHASNHKRSANSTDPCVVAPGI